MEERAVYRVPGRPEERLIEIKLSRCWLILTERELVSLLARNHALWVRAIRRGKHRRRAEKNASRQAKVRGRDYYG
jgi:hypothetical protein